MVISSLTSIVISHRIVFVHLQLQVLLLLQFQYFQLVVASTKTASAIQCDYRKCGTLARVFSQTVEHANSKKEIRQRSARERKKRAVSMEKVKRARKKEKAPNGLNYSLGLPSPRGRYAQRQWMNIIHHLPPGISKTSSSTLLFFQEFNLYRLNKCDSIETFSLTTRASAHPLLHSLNNGYRKKDA